MLEGGAEPPFEKPRVLLMVEKVIEVSKERGGGLGGSLYTPQAGVEGQGLSRPQPEVLWVSCGHSLSPSTKHAAFPPCWASLAI